MSQAIDTLWTTSGPVDEAASLPVRGRRAEQERLTQWVRRHVHRNGGGILWIEGPAGSGKSRMLAYAGSEAALAGAQVLTGTAGTTSSPPLWDALGAEAEDLARGGRPRGDRPGTSHRPPRDLANRLRALARHRPVAVLVDDVHAGDDLTLHALRTLTRQLAGCPLLWVLASRTHPHAPTARALRRDLFTRQATQLVLAPLTYDAVRQMAQDLLGAHAAAATPYLPYLDGMPGTVRQLCAHLQDVAPAGPAETRSVLAWLATRRLDQLSEAARELVLIASVLGDTLAVRHLAQVLDRPEPALLAPLREALSARLLHAGDDRLSFPHPPMREAIAATLPKPLRLSVRRRSIEVRARAGVPAATLAAELADLAEPGDAEAVRILCAAAHDLATVAVGTAARYLKRAVELTEHDCPERRRLTAAAVPLLWQAGEVADARDLARDLLQAPLDPVSHAHACLELARMGSQFRLDQPTAHIRRVQRRREVPVTVRDELLTATLLGRLLAGETDEADAKADAPARPGAHPVGELTRRIRLSMGAAHRQDWASALAHGEAAATGVAHLDPRLTARLPEVAVATSWFASLLDLSGDGRGALDLLDEAVEQADRHGRRAFVPLWRTARARLLLSAGRLTDATRDLAAAEDAATATGLSFTGEPAALCTRAHLAFHTGDEAGLAACAARADELLSTGGPQERRAGAWLTLIAAAYHGRRLTEVQLMAAAAHLEHGRLHDCGTDPADAVVLVRAALSAGRRETAVSVTEFAERRARHNAPFPLFEAAARHARGLLDGDRGRLMQAADEYGSSRPLPQAQAWEDAGTLLTRTDPCAARTLFKRALRAYEACGAERDAQRARGRLRGLGVKTVAGTGAPEAGWRGLTPSELGVVRLIAHGATNRQAAERLFVSPHTVNTHVRHAFEKLGVHSRVQLARLYLTEVDQPADVSF
ncbi:LuxR C-terminal-related transcriptional regulator [Streptomyces sp. 7R007]